MLITLAQLIAQVESSGNNYAVRYEPNWTYTTPDDIFAAVVAHACDQATARVLMSCSWGAYQIMGSVLYDLSPKPVSLNLLRDYLPNPQLQFKYFNHFNQKFCGDAALLDIEDRTAKGLAFCERYNGDGPAYMERCQQVLRQHNG